MRSLRWARRFESLSAYLFLSPLFALLGVFGFYCIFYVFRISFYRWDGINPATMRHVGSSNYEWLFTDHVFYTALKNVLIFMVLTVLIQAVLGLLLALLLRPKLKGHAFFKAIYYIPAAMSATVIAFSFDRLYETNFGLINTLLRGVGLSALARNWLGDPSIALYAIVVANIFQWTGASMVYYIAGLTALNEEYFEAAQIDGAGFWKTLTHIVVPLLTPTHTTVVVLGIVGSIRTFDLVWLLTQGGPGTATQFLATYLYKSAVTEFRAGFGASIGVVMILLALAMALLQYRVYERSKR